MADEVYKNYVFRQNNSGGYFVGPYEFVVTATSIDEAWSILKSQRWYTDEYCECCGPRWYRAGHVHWTMLSYEEID
jgi:hypothetical protein